MFLENGDEGGGDGADDEELEDGIRQDEGGEVDVKIAFETAKEAGGEEVVSNKPEQGRGHVGGGDDKGGGKNTLVFCLEKFLAAVD